MGGSGGSGGVGQNVFAGTNGNIVTSGDYSGGIDASSVGGGGGNGGYALSITGGGTYASLALAFGGTGGTGSKGGDVTVDSTGDHITTDGAFSSAVSARSVGGGGGNGGFTIGVAGAAGAGIALTFAGSGGSGADGGNVLVSTVGNLTTGRAGEAQNRKREFGGHLRRVGGWRRRQWRLRNLRKRRGLRQPEPFDGRNGRWRRRWAERHRQLWECGELPTTTSLLTARCPMAFLPSRSAVQAATAASRFPPAAASSRRSI